MKRITNVTAFAVVLLMTSGSIMANEFGTRDEAKAMLERAAAVLKADKSRALDLFTSGHGGFIKKDLYVFCGGPDGMLTAHPYVMGSNLRDFKDKDGKATGEEIYSLAKAGNFAEVSYKWLRPGGGDEHVDKISFITKVEDQICGVGFYK